MSEFFYSGARRGEILDAVLYVLTHGEGPEGIIALTGDAGSGVSTLCSSMVMRLPARMHTVYIPQPSPDTAGLFNIVARELAPEEAEEESTETDNDLSAPDRLQKMLDRQQFLGVQTVLVFDEAQQMAAEMLERIRVLYELASSQHKLLQIVLAGQRELERVLASPSMHDLKSRVTHWYRLDPLNPLQITAYLTSDEGVARTRGVAFNSRAVKILGTASGGILSALDGLADKSSSIAVSENAKEITEEHVRKAIDESEGKYKFSLRDWSKWHIHPRNRSRASFAASLMLLAALGWLAAHAPSTDFSPVIASTMPEAGSHVVLPVPAAIVATPTPVSIHPSNPPTALPSADRGPGTPPATPKNQAVGAMSVRTESTHDQPAAAAVQQGAGKLNVGGVKLAGFKLLEQRVESTIQTMETVEGNKYTIQLFSTENIQPDRMERFLIRARSLVDLSNLQVHIVKNGDRAKFRVTYGIYPSRAEAAAAIEELPEKYQSEFHPELFAFADLR